MRCGALPLGSIRRDSGWRSIGGGGNDYFAADKARLYITLLTLGYMLSRGIAEAAEAYSNGDGHDGR